MITGTFGADFTAFQTAVEAAQVKLRGFETSAEKVEGKINSLGNAFSGQKIISEAELLTKAITDLGGATTLTEAEQKRVNITLQEAIDKYNALGKEAPASMQALANATADANTSTTSWLSTVAAAATGYFTAEAAMKALTAAWDAGTAAAKFFYDTALQGATVAGVEENFGRLTAQVGLLGDALVGSLREGTHGTITDFELMKAVNADLAAGMNLSQGQFKTLADGAFALAQATGTDVKTAFDAMNDSMRKGKPAALEALVGQIDLTAAQDRYAASIGTVRERLTDEQKVEAGRIATLDAVAAATKRVGEQTDGLGEIVAQAKTAWANFVNDLGKAIAVSEPLKAAFAGVRDILIDAFGGTKEGLIKAVTTAIEDAAFGAINFGRGLVELGGIGAKVWIEIQDGARHVLQVLDSIQAAMLMIQRAGAMGLIPGVPADMGKVMALNAELAKIETRMKDRSVAMAGEQDQLAAVDSATAEWTSKLDLLSGRMDIARSIQGSHVDGIKAGTDASREAAGAAGDHGTALGQVAVSADQANTFLKKLLDETYAPINDEQRENLRMLNEAGQLNEQNARGIGVSADQLRTFNKELKDEKEANDAIMDSWKAMQKEVKELDEFEKARHANNVKRAGEVAADLEKQAAARRKEIADNVVLEMAALQTLNDMHAGPAKTAVEKHTEALDALNKKKADGLPITNQLELLEEKFAKDLLDEAMGLDKVNASTQGANTSMQVFYGTTNEAAAANQRLSEALGITVVGMTGQERALAQVAAGYENARGGLVAYQNQVNSTREAAEALQQVHEKVDVMFGMSSAGGIGIPLLDPNAYNAAIEHEMMMRGYEPHASGSPGVVTGGGGGYRGGFRAGEPHTVNNFNINQPLGTPNQIARAVGSSFNSRMAGQGYRAPES